MQTARTTRTHTAVVVGQHLTLHLTCLLLLYYCYYLISAYACSRLNNCLLASDKTNVTFLHLFVATHEHRPQRRLFGKSLAKAFSAIISYTYFKHRCENERKNSLTNWKRIPFAFTIHHPQLHSHRIVRMCVCVCVATKHKLWNNSCGYELSIQKHNIEL